MKRKVPGKKNGRRNGCVTEERQLARLARKGKSGQFEFEPLGVGRSETLRLMDALERPIDREVLGRPPYGRIGRSPVAGWSPVICRVA